MTFKAKRCKAKSKSTGKRCRQPALEGSDFCRLHYKTETEDSGKETSSGGSKKTTKKEKRSVGAPEQNLNALKHGAYSPRLLPEEEPIYLEKREAFTQALGAVDVFDEQIVHLLSLISTKVDQAVMKGAEHAAYAGMVKQILDLMKELKATRASRDAVAEGRNLTHADLYAELKAHFEKEGGQGDDSEKSNTRLVERHCDRCLRETPHEKTDGGDLTCLNCGRLRLDDEVEEEASSDETASNDAIVEKEN